MSDAMREDDPLAGSVNGGPTERVSEPNGAPETDDETGEFLDPEVLEATVLRWPPHFWRAVLAQMFRKTYEDRVLGMAAEAGFWGIVSLPALLLSLFGGLGYLRGVIGDDGMDSVRYDVLRAAHEVLTPSTVNTVVAPILDEILSRGHPGVISIAFIVSLWTGSTCMSDYVNTITVAYEMRGARSWFWTRVRALLLYLLAVASGIVLLPLLALGPGTITQLFPDGIQDEISLTIKIFYIPVVGIGSVLVVATLYRLALPRRVAWRNGLPGAVLAVALWLGGSFGVRAYLTLSIQNRSAYGQLSAPIAALIFFYVTALAVLLGAELNSALHVIRSRPVRVQARPRVSLRQRVAHRRFRKWRRRTASAAAPAVTSGPPAATSNRAGGAGGANGSNGSNGTEGVEAPEVAPEPGRRTA